HDTFVPAAAAPAVPTTHEAWEALAARWRRALREKVTNNVPALDPERLEPKVVPGAPRLIAFSPDPSYRLEAALVTAAAAPAALPRAVTIRGSERAAWEWTVQAAQVAGGTVSFK